MSNRKIYASLYRVTKEFDINDETTCHIGDIILVNEDGLDGAWGDNLTQTNQSFCPFINYDEVEVIERKYITINQYFSLSRHEKQLNPDNTFPF